MEDFHPIYEKEIECMFKNISPTELFKTIQTITQMIHTLEKMECKN